MKNKILVSRKYKLIDFIIIPIKICPVETVIKIINILLNSLLSFFQVLLTVDFINIAINIFNGEDIRISIYRPLLLMMLLILYFYTNSKIMGYVDIQYDIKMTKVFKCMVLEKRAKLEYKHIENNESWNLISRFCSNPVGAITGGFYAVLDTVSIVIRVISLLSILMANIWWAGLEIIIVSVPLFFIAIKAGKESYDANKKAQEHTRRAAYLQEVLIGRDSVEERILFGYAGHVNKQWHQKYESARKINQKVELKIFVKMKSSSLITIIISMLIIFILLKPLQNGEISIALFIGLVEATLELIQTMSWRLSSTMSRLASYRECLKDLTAFCVLSEEKETLKLPSNNRRDKHFERIEFINVSFKYPNTDTYILNNFSACLNKDVHYAIVGINGAGKTTITKLLVGLYSDFEGEILINGKNIREYKQSELRTLFSVVYQDFAKYYISFKDNILLGNLNNHTQNINDVVQMLELDRVVEKLSNGVDTYLGKIKQGGVDISGGEWQRVAIARALYNPAPVRILDEPTAALDPIVESNIYAAFSKISEDKTTILITHRLGAARLADEILVISDGTIKEHGSHNELIELNGMYAEMFEAQRSWYDNEK